MRSELRPTHTHTRTQTRTYKIVFIFISFLPSFLAQLPYKPILHLTTVPSLSLPSKKKEKKKESSLYWVVNMAESVELPGRLGILPFRNKVLLPGAIIRIRCTSPSRYSLSLSLLLFKIQYIFSWKFRISLCWKFNI